MRSSRRPLRRMPTWCWSTTVCHPARNAISRNSSSAACSIAPASSSTSSRSAHAATRASSQVELAQLKHLATRLVRGWTHLERQRGGGIGQRGPGETQLETDRRLIGKRVQALTERLEKIKQQRETGRQQRSRNPRAVAGPRGLYQCRQVHPVPRADRRRCLYRRPAVRHAGSRPSAVSCSRAIRRWWLPTPWASFASCPTIWWPPSNPRSPRPARPHCSCTSWTSATRGAKSTSRK